MDVYDIAQAHGCLCKVGAAAESTYGLVGRLYASKSGWVLLSVPNAIARGLFDALGEPGIELPLKDGILNAHISVMRPDELEGIGGVNAITERGHEFTYQLGPVKTVNPAGWNGVSRVWFVEIRSPDLSALRRSYGLPSMPTRNGEELPFHLTFAIRKTKVLQENEVAKISEALGDLSYKADCLRAFVMSLEESLDKQSQDASVDELKKVKRLSDAKQYQAKHHLLRTLMGRHPAGWEVGQDKGMASVRNKRTGFRYHMPKRALP